MALLRGARVLVAGAGLAGLTAARDLIRNGADVIVIDARARVGGRVLTTRQPFRAGQHAEAGGDLIDAGQEAICKLIGELGLRRVEILRGGFGIVREARGRRRVVGSGGWRDLGGRLSPEIRAFCLSEKRWDGAIAEALAREPVAAWLDRIRASEPMRATARGMRGFFLADPADLSLLALVDQFADEGAPGGGRMFRIKGGNDRLPEALARPLARRLQLGTILRAVVQGRSGIVASVECRGRLSQLRADYMVCALPATTLRNVELEPRMNSEQHQAIGHLKYGAATKTALQFERATWRRPGRPTGFGTNLPIGAVWDGNEDQRGRPAILTLLAGGKASRETQSMLASGGPTRLTDQLTWLGLGKTPLLEWSSVSWENDEWAGGGYAFFDPAYRPSIRSWLARPFGRITFAGEHTSLKWQRYMNGAVETGQRAAEEVAALHRLQPPGAKRRTKSY